MALFKDQETEFDRTSRAAALLRHLHFSSAMVILSGALYAGLFAWSRPRGLPRLMSLAFIEPAMDGSTWQGYFEARRHPWFIQGMYWRQIFGWVTATGYTYCWCVGSAHHRRPRVP